MTEKEINAVDNFKSFIKTKEREQDTLYENEEFYRDDIEQNELFLKMLHSILHLIQTLQEEKERLGALYYDANEMCYKARDLIQKQQEALEEKDKIIDRIYDFIWENDCCRYFYKQNTVCNKKLNFDSCLGNCKRHCIQKYFEKAEDWSC